MGMDLIPRKRGAESLHYNWSEWQFVINLAQEAGVDTSEFDGYNDGRLISAVTCRNVGGVIKQHAKAYNQAFAGEAYGDDPATEHAATWQNSSGMRQF